MERRAGDGGEGGGALHGLANEAKIGGSARRQWTRVTMECPDAMWALLEHALRIEARNDQRQVLCSAEYRL
jgi:hypothetical protein